MKSPVLCANAKIEGSACPREFYLRQKSEESCKQKIIVIAGPTAVGKSDVAFSIARAIDGEIISADSMQVYRGMDIGTSKPPLSERGQIRHHLIDSRDLEDTFNVVDFYQEANQAIEETLSRDRVPIVVGGTGFYIHSLLYGPPHGPPSVPEVRLLIEEEMNCSGPALMHAKLMQLDPEYGATISLSDRHKIVRALEIITLTNQKASLFKNTLDISEEYDFRCWFLHMPRSALYTKIEKRCDRMIAEGFLKEVEDLKNASLQDNLSASQSIGYRQALTYLNSPQTSKDHALFIDSFKQASRRYAKRQFTWFRKEPLFRWIDVESGASSALETIIQDFESV